MSIRSYLRELIRRRYGGGFMAALDHLRGAWRLSRLHRAGVRDAVRYRGQTGLQLNLACGDNIKAGWVNIDLFDPAPVDLRLDLTEPLPFADHSVRTIYCEHFFEHLEFPTHARGFLREAFRVLEPRGVLSIGVPDTEWPLRCYAAGDDSYFRFGRATWGHPDWCNTPLHQINFHFRQFNEHRYAYDESTLAKVLVEEGFVQPLRREFDPLIDSDLRRIGTLYMDAIRPRSDGAP